MTELIPILLSAIAVATVLNVALKRLNMPTIIGYIITGAIVGSAFNIRLHDHEELEHIAEFGVVFLMFTIGLEFSFNHLKEMRREVFVYGFLQVAVSATVFALACHILLEAPWSNSVIVGCGIALSSTAIVLKIINETGQIKSDFGRKSLGILIFQDISVVPILLMVTLFTSSGENLGELLLKTAINAAAALAILVVVGRFLLSHVFRIVAAAQSREIYMGSVLLTVIGSSYIAHAFGFSWSLGAFIAGMMIADTIYKYQVEADLIPFRDLLLGVFFVSVGLQLEMSVVAANILTILVLGIVLMAAKAILIFAILAYGNDRREALKTAVSLSQIGEFSLVVFSLVLSHGMLDATWVQIVLVTIVASMIVTPLIINNADRIADLVFKRRIEAQLLDQAASISGHVILCGYGSFGRVVSDRLDEAGDNHVILTDNTDDYMRARENSKSVVFGDPADPGVLERLRIRSALSTIVALDDFDSVKRVCAAITLIDPALKIIAKVPTEEDRAELADFNNELVLDDNSHTASLLVQRIDKSRLLARETSRLRHLSDYSLTEPVEAIRKVEQEQIRLLDVMSKSFDAMRQENRIFRVKALHDSFMVLSEIIGDAINDIMHNATLSVSEYERVHTLLDNQHQLESINHVLEQLARDLVMLGRNENTHDLATMAVEGLDTILLSLRDIAKDFDEDEMQLFREMTERGSQGLSRIRESYLSPDAGLDAPAKALLLSTTNHLDHLKSLFGLVGHNYQKLSQTA